MKKEDFTVEELRNLFQNDYNDALIDYFTFLKFPSISTDPNYADSVKSCAEWLTNYLRSIGFKVELWPTSGHPTIFASHLQAGPDQPTLLIYNHYDVQPIDPLNEWTSPPFQPTIKNGQVYARGAQDNKGQCFYTVHALKMLLQRDGSLPINVKLCIEGEEECGSTGLSGLLQAKKEQLRADYVAVVDLGLQAPDKPSITLGLRGITALDVEVQGSFHDLHSGMHGGIAFNPNHALIQLLASLRDPATGKVTVPGFYDDVESLPEKERKLLSLSFEEKEYENTFGIQPTGGEVAFSPLERNWIRPTLEINGIYGGYCGAGVKTVIPAKANAKITCRLVANQDPKKIANLVAEHLKKHAPKGVKVNVHLHPGGGKAARASANSPVVQAFAKSFTELFGKPCAYIYEGGSIPIIPDLAAAAGGDVVMLGFGYADDQIHAPNEHFGIDRLEKGFIIIAKALYNLKR